MFTKELSEWKRESGLVHPVLYKYDYNKRVLSIYTNSPGWLVGKAGALYDKYKGVVETRAGHKVEIVFVETAYDVI